MSISPITEGSPAPPFDLPATGGGRVSLEALQGRPFVLYFYPRADTPGCTKEAEAFQAALPELDIPVVGVSKDPLPAFRAHLIEKGIATEEQLAAMQTGIEAEVADAIEFGLASPFPGVEELRRDVFATEIPA